VQTATENVSVWY